MCPFADAPPFSGFDFEVNWISSGPRKCPSWSRREVDFPPWLSLGSPLFGLKPRGGVDGDQSGIPAAVPSLDFNLPWMWIPTSPTCYEARACQI
jgi:hypothetical protein